MGKEDAGANSEREYLRKQLQYPDWYIKLEDYLKTQIYPVVHDNPEFMRQRNRFYSLVEEMLDKGGVPLAREGLNLDAERKPIDTVVIHHTEEDPDITLERLNAIGFVRQYAQNYLHGDVWGKKGLRGQPIWSGHFRDFGNGQQMTFFAYHWLIRPDGRAERLLEDGEIGHHAGNLNLESIGLSFSGNYEHSTPPVEQIEEAAKIIKENYSFVENARILGHCEVMEARTCPGDMFLGQQGWKNILIAEIEK